MFDIIKNQLNLRPIYHYSTKRVKAHIFICVLAFLIETIIERFIDKSARNVIDELKRIRISEIKAGHLQKKILT